MNFKALVRIKLVEAIKLVFLIANNQQSFIDIVRVAILIYTRDMDHILTDEKISFKEANVP